MKKLKIELAWSFAQKISAFAFFLLFSAVIARIGGVDFFAKFSLLFSLLTIFGVFAFWEIPTALGTFLAREENLEKQRDFALGAFLALGVSFLFFIGFFVIFSGMISEFFDRKISAEIFVKMTPLFLLFGIAEIQKAIFVGTRNLRPAFFLATAEGVARIGGVFAIAAAPSLEKIVAVLGIASAFGIATGFFFTEKYFFCLPKKNEVISAAKKIVKYGSPLVLTAIGTLFLTEIDTIMIAKMASENNLAMYSAAKRIFGALPQFAVAIAAAVIPAIARGAKKNDFLKTLWLSGAAAIIGAFFLFVAATPILKFLYGENFVAATPIFQILCGYFIVSTLSVIVGKFLDFRGDAAFRVKSVILTIITNIGLNFALIPKFGAAGAAGATAVCLLPALFYNFRRATTHFSKI